MFLNILQNLQEIISNVLAKLQVVKPITFLKTNSCTGMNSVNFLRTPFLQNTSGRLQASGKELNLGETKLQMQALEPFDV